MTRTTPWYRNQPLYTKMHTRRDHAQGLHRGLASGQVDMRVCQLPPCGIPLYRLWRALTGSRFEGSPTLRPRLTVARDRRPEHDRAIRGPREVLMRAVAEHSPPSTALHTSPVSPPACVALAGAGAFGQFCLEAYRQTGGISVSAV